MQLIYCKSTTYYNAKFLLTKEHQNPVEAVDLQKTFNGRHATVDTLLSDGRHTTVDTTR